MTNSETCAHAAAGSVFRNLTAQSAHVPETLSRNARGRRPCLSRRAFLLSRQAKCIGNGSRPPHMFLETRHDLHKIARTVSIVEL